MRIKLLVSSVYLRPVLATCYREMLEELLGQVEEVPSDPVALEEQSQKVLLSTLNDMLKNPGEDDSNFAIDPFIFPLYESIQRTIEQFIRYSSFRYDDIEFMNPNTLALIFALKEK